MEKIILYTLLITFTLSCSLINSDKDPLDTGADIWVSARVSSKNHRVAGTVGGLTWGNMATDEIDWDAMTHLLYSSLTPNDDGSLPEVIDYQNVNPDRLISIVTTAHENDVPILMTFGNNNSREQFNSAYSDTNRVQLVNNLINFIKKWGFDGIDLKVEPLLSQDTDGFVKFVELLHRELQKMETPLLDRPLLTTSAESHPLTFKYLEDKFDQINIPTYGMSLPLTGWFAWHNTPIYNGEFTYPDNITPLPSIQDDLYEFINVGIDRTKLGISLSFYGYEWNGASRPREGIQNGVFNPTTPWYVGTPYFEIAEKYNLEKTRWDPVAKVPYLSMEEPSIFVSFDNERSIEEKIKFIRKEGIGGLMIWDLTAGYLNNVPDNKDRLLQAVKKELHKYHQ